MTKVRKPIKERKEEIFWIIVDIISEHGFMCVSTVEIAKRLGVSQPAIYKYFPNKEELIVYFLDNLKEILSGIVANAKKGKTTEEKISLLYQNHLELIERTKILPRVVFSDEIYLDGSKKRKKLKEVITSYKNKIKKIVEDGIKKGEIRDLDPDLVVKIFIGSILSTSLEWMLNGMNYSLVSQKDKLMDYMRETIFIKQGQE
jgi:AcrR family transcriptional regulator